MQISYYSLLDHWLNLWLNPFFPGEKRWALGLSRGFSPRVCLPLGLSTTTYHFGFRTESMYNFLLYVYLYWLVYWAPQVKRRRIGTDHLQGTLLALARRPSVMRVHVLRTDWRHSQERDKLNCRRMETDYVWFRLLHIRLCTDWWYS